MRLARARLKGRSEAGDKGLRVIHNTYPPCGELQACNYFQRVASEKPTPTKAKPTSMFQAPIPGIGYEVELM